MLSSFLVATAAVGAAGKLKTFGTGRSAFTNAGCVCFVSARRVYFNCLPTSPPPPPFTLFSTVLLCYTLPCLCSPEMDLFNYTVTGGADSIGVMTHFWT